MEEDGDVSILHIHHAGRAQRGTIRCTATLPVQSERDGHAVDKEQQHTRSSISSRKIASACCVTELALIDDSEDEEAYEDMVDREEDEEAAMVLRGPQDTTALVGERVLLKATYVGRPEPTVRWTRAVSAQCFIGFQMSFSSS